VRNRFALEKKEMWGKSCFTRRHDTYQNIGYNENVSCCFAWEIHVILLIPRRDCTTKGYWGYSQVILIGVLA
jgi:hypothetical protein